MNPPLIHPSIVIVTGPTGTGKTALSVALAQRLGAVVLSADSQLVYQGLDIGTAKPTQAERQGILHEGLDLVAPDQVYSAAQYKAYALQRLEYWLSQGQSVVVAGGTGFYLRQVFEVATLPEVPPNEALRQQLRQEADLQGVEALHARLSQQDPRRAGQLAPRDLNRIVRALEIIAATGQPVPTQPHQPRYPQARWIGLQPISQPWHWHRLEQRVDTMLADGWRDEVAQLMQQFGPEAHALQVAHGYPELVQVLQGTTTLAEATAQIVINVRQYARRQRVWFARNPAIDWHTISEETCFETLADTLLKNSS